MPGRYDIYVFKHDGVYHVWPKVAIVDRTQKKVLIRNLTERGLKVSVLEKPATFQPATGKVTTHGLKVKVPGKLGTLQPATGKVPKFYTLDLDPGASGPYEYAVHVDLGRGVRVPAIAGSWPLVIVDP